MEFHGRNMLFSNNRYLLVCCEAVRLAILAIAWLLVRKVFHDGEIFKQRQWCIGPSRDNM